MQFVRKLCIFCKQLYIEFREGFIFIELSSFYFFAILHFFAVQNGSFCLILDFSEFIVFSKKGYAYF